MTRHNPWYPLDIENTKSELASSPELRRARILDELLKDLPVDPEAHDLLDNFERDLLLVAGLLSPGNAGRVAELLLAFGYHVTPEAVRDRLSALRKVLGAPIGQAPALLRMAWQRGCYAHVDVLRAVSICNGNVYQWA